MPSILDALVAGGRSMAAHSSGAQLAGHNIANASTPGFHRQTQSLAARPWPSMGVATSGGRRAVDGLLEQRLRDEAGQASGAGTFAAGMGQLEGVVGGATGADLGAAFNGFFAALRQAEAAPHDTVARQGVLQAATRLGRSFGTLSSQLEAQRADANRALGQTANEVSSLAARVATLNREIVVSETSGREASDLRDERDQAARRIAELAGGTSFEDERGALSVTIADGISLVQGDVATPLELSTRADGLLAIRGGAVDLTARLADRRHGELGARLELRDSALPAEQQTLDRLAFDFASAVNAAHAAGFGLDGAGGRNLFNVAASSTGAAASLSLDSSVASDAGALALSSSAATLPSGNDNAQALIRLESVALANGGTATVEAALAAWVGTVGHTAGQAASSAEDRNAALQTLETLREQVSGVSIEEQMLDLDRYQRAYQASVKVVQALDAMMEDLLAL